MNGADDRGALGKSLVLKHFTNFQGSCAIEATRRFITEEQVGISNKFISNARPLSLSTRDALNHLATNSRVSAILKAESLYDIFYFVFDFVVI